MKKTMFLAVMAAMMLASCGSKTHQEQATEATDSLAAVQDSTEVQEPEAQEAAAPALILTKDGIGELKINMPLSKIPASIEGLYDKVTQEKEVEEDEGEEMVYIYLKFLKDGKKVLEGISWSTTELDHLDILTDAVSLMVDGKAVKVGDSTKGLPLKDIRIYDGFAEPGINGVFVNGEGKIESFTIGQKYFF